MDIIRQGQVYFIHLDPAFGREIGGYKPRPVAVVSINDIQRNTRIVMVVPGTSTSPRTEYQNVVDVQPDARNRLTNRTYFQCHQLRAVDQGRMTSAPIGELARADLERIRRTVANCIGLPMPDPRG